MLWFFIKLSEENRLGVFQGAVIGGGGDLGFGGREKKLGKKNFES